jgi:hypothetical protein
MSAASERAKADRDARIAESQRLRAADIADTQKYRMGAFKVFAGPVRSYITATKIPSTGGVELDLVEWKTSQGSVPLTREEVETLIAGLQRLIK